jgi:hypothetical protein
MKARTVKTAIMSEEAAPSGQDTAIARSVRSQPAASPAVAVASCAGLCQVRPFEPAKGAPLSYGTHSELSAIAWWPSRYYA